jgi:molybdopterin/thiamine biosynthesis adenylyltransferase/rhodanese-related sulfurtransferase
VTSYQDLLAELKTQIHEISADEAAARHASDEPPVLIDVREPDEFDQGAIDSSVHIPRGNLESRIGGIVPDLSTPIVITCQSGARSAFAARSLEELGYEDVVSLAGGFGAWKQSGLPWSTPRVLSAEQRARYSRHTLIPEVGERGQLKLLESTVLLVGAGGLGSPAGLYLAAAGVGTIAIVDADVVDESNLQRQVLHSMASIGMPKTESARQRIEELNPDVRVVTYRERLTSENIDRLLEGVDVIVDGTDNFPTRYLLNDASLRHRIPVVHASIFRFEGQLTASSPTRPCVAVSSRSRRPSWRRARRAGVLGVLPASWDRCRRERSCCRDRQPRRPGILFDARHELPRGAPSPRPGLLRSAVPDAEPIEYIDYEEFWLRLRGQRPHMLLACLPSCAPCGGAHRRGRR